MTPLGDDRLLATIDTIYAAALSPAQYEAFAAAWDAYLSAPEPASTDAPRIITHIDNALAIIERLHSTPAANASPDALVAAEAAPAAVVSADGAVLAANQNWRRFGPHPGGSLWALAGDPAEEDAFKSALRRLHDVTETRTSLARLTDGDTGRPRFASIRRLSAEPAPAGGPHYLVRLARSVWSPAVEAYLAAEFRLTPAETALTERMAEGLSFAEIAAATGRAVDTLKTQAKSVYAKMGVAGREDAVRAALYLHLLMDSSVERPPAIAEPAERSAVLAGRRRLVWTRRGASEGRAFLFLHGMSLGHGMTRTFEEELAARNLSAICIDRPGYGRSDPPGNWRRGVEEWAALFPDLMDALGLDHAPIVTHTSGVLYACAAASAHPGRVSGVCALAGGVPITDPAMLADYPMQTRIIARTAQFSPSALRFVVASAAAFYHRALGTQRLIARTYSSTPADAEALKDKEIFDLVCAGMEMISAGGLDGFVGDACRIFGDWSSCVREMRAPLHYVVGEDDPICPLDWARGFAQRFTHVDVAAIPAAGQLLHHSRPAAVVEEIAGFIDGLA